MTPLLLSLMMLASPGPPPCSPAWLEEARLADVRCSAETGAKWHFVFAYPEAAAGTPALHRELEARRARARRGLDSFLAYAGEHPEGRFSHEEVYVLDANRPELIAMSSSISEYAGGAHPWHAAGTLIWDRAAGREIGVYDLFSDGRTARSELKRLYCPALLAIRRRATEGSFRGGCDDPPGEATLVAGDDGRIDTLRVRHGEMEGYAGPEYDILLPVTPRLIAAMKMRFRPAFRPSSAPPLGCASNLRDPACAARRHR